MRKRGFRNFFENRGRGGGRFSPTDNPTKPGSGPGGFCVCPKCGKKVGHVRAVPCVEQKCPQCGTRMLKE